MENKEDYSEYIDLIAYATYCDYDTAEKKLNKILKSGRKPIAIYPGLGEKATDDMEYIGSIEDGCLYITKI